MLRPRFGAESLRYAMVVFTFLSPWPLFHYWRAGLLLRREKTFTILAREAADGSGRVPDSAG